MVCFSVPAVTGLRRFISHMDAQGHSNGKISQHTVPDGEPACASSRVLERDLDVAQMVRRVCVRESALPSFDPVAEDAGRESVGCNPVVELPCNDERVFPPGHRGFHGNSLILKTVSPILEV